MSDYLMQLQKNLDGLTRRVDSLIKPETASAADYTKVAALYQSLPCLRFLGLGGLGSGGEWRDASNNGMSLTYNGNPVMSYTTQGAPYFYYDGVGDFHSHADDAHFDITGTDTVVAAAVRGMTCGAWVYFQNGTGSSEWILSKYLTTGNQRSYALRRAIGGVLQAYVSTDGTALVNVVSVGTLSQAVWYFVAMRFMPSATLDNWLNDTKATQAAGVPASIFNGTAVFEVNGINAGGTELMTGRVGFPFVCACALSDAIIGQLYQSSRGLFGV